MARVNRAMREFEEPAEEIQGPPFLSEGWRRFLPRLKSRKWLPREEGDWNRRIHSWLHRSTDAERREPRVPGSPWGRGTLTEVARSWACSWNQKRSFLE